MEPPEQPKSSTAERIGLAVWSVRNILERPPTMNSPGSATVRLAWSRVEHSHWSKYVQILCSDWLNLTKLVP